MKINTYPLNMDALGFDGYICGIRNSVIRNSEASGESLDEVCLYTDTADTHSQVDGWYTCDQCLAVAQRRHGQEIMLGLPKYDARLNPDLRCLAKFLCVAVLYIQLGTSF